ncbi:hypothetical protein Poly41_32650 [Novipirellula artificiosorum]|uniref:Uncharacterized protein n=1 Tax=Novipirellula artificiosorum TaxID=2528016 RepID=A0A5C6DK73_9BACT|nr:hypothetical protein Poly41_32650 [Novipirellula artificiosorum]
MWRDKSGQGSFRCWVERVVSLTAQDQITNYRGGEKTPAVSQRAMGLRPIIPECHSSGCWPQHFRVFCPSSPYHRQNASRSIWILPENHPARSSASPQENLALTEIKAAEDHRRRKWNTFELICVQHLVPFPTANSLRSILQFDPFIATIRFVGPDRGQSGRGSSPYSRPRRSH